jgi:hypothetical protein
MDTSLRRAGPDDLQPLMTALYRAKRLALRRCNKAHIRQTYHEPVERYLRDALAGTSGSHCYHVGGMFFMFRVAYSWQKGAPILVEELVLRLGPGGTLADVTVVAETMARELGCVGVVFGTAFSDRDETLSAAYQQLGYQEEARLLYKEIT